jgi:hypothetical protein
MFPESISDSFRVVTTSHGQGDSETTIPLGRWSKGGGLEGSKGHVYEYGSGWAGIWLKGRTSKKRLEALKPDFPDLKVMQVGEGETTAKVPFSVLDGILPLLSAKRRFKASEAQMASMMKANEISKPSRFKKRPDATGPKTD